VLKPRLIPCLDVKDGRVVKGVSFENLLDAGDPVAQAKFYYEQGADELCFLDIAASQENRATMLEMVKKVAEVCFIPFTVGGGVKEVEDIYNLLQCGADKVSINSAAIKNPEIISQASRKFGAQCVVVAIDAKKNSAGNFEIFSHGGKKETGIDAIAWAKKAQELGAGEILLTSIDKDGTKSGYDLELLAAITSQVSIPVIASGGVGKLEHLLDGLNAGASAVLAASIFHFKEFSLTQAKDFLRKNGVEMR
jgi:cyclase